VPNDRDVTFIDDLQDTASRASAGSSRIATRLAGPRVGAFWKPVDPALISLPGPACARWAAGELGQNYSGGNTGPLGLSN